MFRILTALLTVSVALTSAHFRPYPHLNGNGRIIGGKATTIDEHPYQVSIQNDGSHWCGGSILTNKYILTAAHCLPMDHGFDRNVTVVVGVNDRRQKDRPTYIPSKYIVYPKYDRNKMDGDIAIIVVNKPIQFGPKVQPIPLVALPEHPKPGDMLTFTGWGNTEIDNHKPQRRPKMLQEAILPVLSQEMCRKSVKAAQFPYTDNMMCSGGSIKPKLPSNGDSGGPAVTDKKKLAGVISWGKTRNLSGAAIVMTDVASPPIADFIKSVLNGTITK